MCQEPLRSWCAAKLGAQGAGKIVRRLRKCLYRVGRGVGGKRAGGQG